MSQRVTGILPPNRAVVQTYEQDGAWWWLLECNHSIRVGRWPIKAMYQLCHRCVIEKVTERNKESQQ